MSPERIAEIRAAEQAATPGPWEVDGPGPDMRRNEEDPDDEKEWRNHAAWVNTPDMAGTCEGDYLRTQDADFCALAREAVPELLAEVERLTRVNADLTEQIMKLEEKVQHLHGCETEAMQCLGELLDEARAAIPECEHCGKPASCLGAYEGGPEAWACDECCGHGAEDGHCVRVRGLPRVVEDLRGKASDEPFFERQVAALPEETPTEATCEWLYCRECGSVTSIPSLMSLVNIKCEICWRKLNKINLNTINLLNNTLQDTIKALQTIEDYIIKGTVDNVTDLIETLNLVLEATSTNYPKTLENITSIEDIPNEYNSRIW